MDLRTDKKLKNSLHKLKSSTKTEESILNINKSSTERKSNVKKKHLGKKEELTSSLNIIKSFFFNLTECERFLPKEREKHFKSERTRY